MGPAMGRSLAAPALQGPDPWRKARNGLAKNRVVGGPRRHLRAAPGPDAPGRLPSVRAEPAVLVALGMRRCYTRGMPPLVLSAAENLGRFALKQRGARSLWQPTARGYLHYYELRGKGSLPPLVLLHGLGTAATAFAPLLAHLRPHISRVLAPDHLGHGFSGGHHEALTPDDVIHATSEALLSSLDEPAILIGNSMGGALALKFAASHPDKVRGLVLVSPAGAPFEASDWNGLTQAFDIRCRAQASALFARVYHSPPWFLPLVAHEISDHFGRPAMRSLLASPSTSALVTPDELASLRVPILLLWGRSDNLLPRQHLDYFRRHLPSRAQVEEPEAFGHSPHLDASKPLADYIVRFGREVATEAAPPKAEASGRQ